VVKTTSGQIITDGKGKIVAEEKIETLTRIIG
jgi:hypothetical protein